MRQPIKLISNAYRTVSLNNQAVRQEAFGQNDCLGYRSVNGNLQPTGFATDTAADDPLEILLREEEELELIEIKKL